MVTSRGGMTVGQVAAAAVAASLLLAPAVTLAGVATKRPAAISLSFDGLGGFTPAGGDPRLAAELALRPAPVADFKFTPAAANGRPSQIRVAIRARAIRSTEGQASDIAAAPALALTPSSYNLGVAVGWRRFAIDGDVTRVTNPAAPIGNHESAVVGVSYNLKKFTGRVAMAADHGDGRIAALRDHDSMQVDLGGAYRIGRSVALTGGVRYKIEQDRAAALADQRRDSQAVYVGTAFKF